jgi:hypothetical protein
MKLNNHSTVVINGLIFFIGMSVGWVQFAFWNPWMGQKSSSPNVSFRRENTADLPRPPEMIKSTGSKIALLPTLSAQPPIKTNPVSGVTPQPIETPIEIADKGELKSNFKTQGGFRVSNLSQHPIRLALLSRKSDKTQTVDKRPAHWDFAPREGSHNGLRLSLPDTDLQLKPGDILVGFAQDGSRRYWGPYIVGDTEIPFWNGKTSEWQLIIEP